jgi:hypothetical protein
VVVVGVDMTAVEVEVGPSMCERLYINCIGIN